MKTNFKEDVKHDMPGLPLGSYSVRRDKPGTVSPLHWHEDIEFLLVSEGVAAVTIGDDMYLASDGDILVVNSGELHQIDVHTCPLCYDTYSFPMELLGGDEELEATYIRPLREGGMAIRPLLKAEDTYTQMARKAFSELEKAYAARLPGFGLLVRADLLRVLGYMAAGGHLVKAAPKGEADRKQESLKLILHYINMHSDEKLALDTVAAQFNLSPKYFCNFFKRHFGRTFVDYLNFIRLEKAAVLLGQTTRPISDVARTAGYENFSYFIRRFKQQYGCTPSAYRAQMCAVRAADKMAAGE